MSQLVSYIQAIGKEQKLHGLLSCKRSAGLQISLVGQPQAWANREIIFDPRDPGVRPLEIIKHILVVVRVTMHYKMELMQLWDTRLHCAWKRVSFESAQCQESPK